MNSALTAVESARRRLFLGLLYTVWAFTIVYSVLFYVLGAKLALGAEVTGTVVLCPLIWWLEQKRFHLLARLTFIGTCNFLLIYTVSLGFAHQISAEYYYLPATILPFLLFESSKKKGILGSVSGSFLLWVIASVGGSAFVPYEWLPINAPTAIIRDVSFLGAFAASSILLSLFIKTTFQLQQLNQLITPPDPTPEDPVS